MNKIHMGGTASPKNEIIVYQPNDTIRLEVRIENETVWLNRNQMATLFGRDVKTIGKHIANALEEELSPTVANSATVGGAALETSPEVVVKFATAVANGKVYMVEHYSLEMVVSVGFRVKSSQGIAFRRWANVILRNHLLHGYSIGSRVNQLEDKVDRRFAQHDAAIADLREQVGFFVRTEIPPKEGVLFEGQIKDGYDLALSLIRLARKSVVLIDNWVDERVLTMLESRASKASATIYTKNCTKKLQLDVANHNRQYRPISLKAYRGAHDRFLIVDETVYHIGASLKDLGTALFAFSRMEIPAKLILDSTGVPGTPVESH